MEGSPPVLTGEVELWGGAEEGDEGEVVEEDAPVEGGEVVDGGVGEGVELGGEEG